MTRYSVQLRYPIFVKGYGLSSFAKIMGRNIGENISKNESGKYSQKLDLAKQSATDAFKTASKRAIQKTTVETDDLIDNKIANKTARVSKSLQQNHSETVTNENDKEIWKERYISLEQRKKTTDDLRLLW